MKIAFLTEMNFIGKIPVNHPNMRTEFAWMHALNADHHNINNFFNVKEYDHIFVIFPKGKTFLNAEGSSLSTQANPISDLLASDIVTILKQSNKRVYYLQEGPHWWYNDYELKDQINFYNLLMSCDAIFAHNESDTLYYKGLVGNKPIHTIPTLMIEHSIHNIYPQTEDRAIIGGNFARWYGGFESYMIAQEFGVDIWGQTSHATRPGEDQLIKLLPRVMWIDWMKQLSSFKYAVHLMPTVAAGTFSLNCAYFGIPCIGNVEVDTQKYCHPNLSVKISDLNMATKLAKELVSSKEFYILCSNTAKENYKKYYGVDVWINRMDNILKENLEND